MNACDIGISSKIYEFVIWKGKKLTGNDAAEILLKNQLDGIRKCVDMGIFVKVNIVLIPGVNDGHIPKLADLVKKMGVYIVNILPLIPVEGSRFSGLRAPAPGERRRLAEICSDGVRMMRHCKQCRADAVGLLDDDRSGEFTAGNCGSGCGPADMTSKRKDNGIRIAAASEDGITISGGFGNTGSFRKYVVRDNGIKDDGIVYVKEHGGVYGDAHTRHIMDRMALLKDTDIVIVREIGPRPLNELRNAGKHVHIASGSVEDAIHKAISSMSG
jgi:nitrogen fixation protein NifB